MVALYCYCSISPCPSLHELPITVMVANKATHRQSIMHKRQWAKWQGKKGTRYICPIMSYSSSSLLVEHLILINLVYIPYSYCRTASHRWSRNGRAGRWTFALSLGLNSDPHSFHTNSHCSTTTWWYLHQWVCEYQGGVYLILIEQTRRRQVVAIVVLFNIILQGM